MLTRSYQRTIMVVITILYVILPVTNKSLAYNLTNIEGFLALLALCSTYMLAHMLAQIR